MEDKTVTSSTGQVVEGDVVVVDISMAALDELIHKISLFGDDKRDPPAAKRLEGDHVKGLVSFLKSEEEPVLTKAITNLGDAARIKGNRDLIGALLPIPRIVEIFKGSSASGNVQSQRMCLRLLGNLCYDHPYNREQLQKAKGVALVFDVLKITTDEEVQRVACGCIANMASNTEEICQEIYSLGGLNNILSLIKSTNDNVQCMAARALRNVCETEDIINFVYSKGILEYSIDIIKNAEDDDSMVLEFVGLINALVGERKILNEFVYKYNGIDILLNALVAATDVNLIADLQNFFDSISENEETKLHFEKDITKLKQIFLNKNYKNEIRLCAGKTYANVSQADKLLERFYGELDEYVALLSDDNKEVQLVAAMLIGSLARSEANCIDMVNRGVANVLVDVIKNEERDLRVRHYCTGTLRNISINERNKKLIFENGVMEPLIKLLKNPKLNQVVVYQAIGVLKNLISGGDVFIKSFITFGGIPNMMDLINFDETDHLKFESSRVIVLLLKTEFAQDEILTLGGVQAINNLLNSKFDLLRLEALTSLTALLNQKRHEKLVSNKTLLKYLLSTAAPTLKIKEAESSVSLASTTCSKALDLLVEILGHGGVSELIEVIGSDVEGGHEAVKKFLETSPAAGEGAGKALLQKLKSL